jgi:hypothetical protein
MGRIPKSVQAKGEPDLTAWTMIQTPKETIPAEIRYARALSTPVPFQGSSQLRPEGGRTPPRPNERGSPAEAALLVRWRIRVPQRGPTERRYGTRPIRIHRMGSVLAALAIPLA